MLAGVQRIPEIRESLGSAQAAADTIRASEDPRVQDIAETIDVVLGTLSQTVDVLEAGDVEAVRAVLAYRGNEGFQARIQVQSMVQPTT